MSDAPSDIYAQIDAYLAQSVLPADPILDAVAAASDQAGLVPHAVTRLQAAFLAILVKTSGARDILEIGCLGGYSAIAMARALPDDGRLITTEIDTRTASIARDNIARSGYGDKIDLIVGPALPYMDSLIAAQARFDFVFIDADKANHRNYLERALQLTGSGSLIIVDNIVREGSVLQTGSPENSIQGVRALLAAAQQLSGVSMTALQSVGEKGHDGMLILRVE